MSGIVSGIGKVFTSIAGGAARLGSAVRGVGASLFTAGAATGASAAGGGLAGLFGSGSVLGRMLSGASSVMNVIPGVGPALAATPAAAATGFGAVAPAVASAATESGLVAANTATGLAPAGGKLLKGLGTFLGSEGGAGLVAGLGTGIGEYMKAKSEEDMAEADRQFLRDKERRITEGYDVPASALVGGEGYEGDTTERPLPGQLYAKPSAYANQSTVKRAKEAWKYNPASGQIEMAQV